MRTCGRHWTDQEDQLHMNTKMAADLTDPSLLAHLYRRAGFGATREQIDGLSTKKYEEVVEFLLNPTTDGGVPDDEIARYMGGEAPHAYLATWMFRMINSQNQLQEKMALFWHLSLIHI